MPNTLTSYTDFASSIKAKYPQYKDVDDYELSSKIVSKYPQYKERVDFSSYSQPDIEDSNTSQVEVVNNPIQQQPIAITTPQDRQAVSQTKYNVPQYNIEEPKVQDNSNLENIPEEYRGMAREGIERGEKIKELTDGRVGNILRHSAKSTIEHIKKLIDYAAENVNNSLTGGMYVDDNSKLIAPYDDDYDKSKSYSQPEIGKRLDDWIANKPVLTNKVDQKIAGLLPTFGVIGLSAATAQPELATAYFMASGAGDALKSYDDYKEQTGEEVNPNTRAAVALTGAAVMALPFDKYIKGILPKGLFNKGISKLATSPEMEQSAKAIWENYLKTNPTEARKVLTNVGKKIGGSVLTMQEIEQGKMAIDKFLVGRDVDSDEWMHRTGEALEDGVLFGILMTPFGLRAQSKYDTQRRNQQGSVVLGMTEKGQSFEVVQDAKGEQVGLTPMGDYIKLTPKDLKDVVKIPTDVFNNSIEYSRQKGNKGKLYDSAAMDALSGNLNKFTYKGSGQVIATTKLNDGKEYFIIDGDLNNPQSSLRVIDPKTGETKFVDGLMPDQINVQNKKDYIESVYEQNAPKQESSAETQSPKQPTPEQQQAQITKLHEEISNNIKKEYEPYISKADGSIHRVTNAEGEPFYVISAVDENNNAEIYDPRTNTSRIESLNGYSEEDISTVDEIAQKAVEEEMANQEAIKKQNQQLQYAQQQAEKIPAIFEYNGERFRFKQDQSNWNTDGKGSIRVEVIDDNGEWIADRTLDPKAVENIRKEYEEKQKAEIDNEIANLPHEEGDIVDYDGKRCVISNSTDNLYNLTEIDENNKPIGEEIQVPKDVINNNSESKQGGQQPERVSQNTVTQTETPTSNESSPAAPESPNTIKFPIGKTEYEAIQNEDGSFEIPVPEGVNASKVEKDIRSTVPENEQDRIQVQKETLTQPSVTPWGKPTTTEVVKSIRVLPEQTQETQQVEGTKEVPITLDGKPISEQDALAIIESADDVSDLEGLDFSSEKLKNAFYKKFPDQKPKEPRYTLAGTQLSKEVALNRIVKARNIEALNKIEVFDDAEMQKALDDRKNLLSPQLPKARLKEEVLKKEPDSMRELIMQYFLGGGRVNTEEIKRELIGRDNTGKLRSQGEFQSRLGFMSNESPSIDQLQERLLPGTPFENEMDDPTNFRNEVIDVLSSYTSRDKILEDLVDGIKTPEQAEFEWMQQFIPEVKVEHTEDGGLKFTTGESSVELSKEDVSELENTQLSEEEVNSIESIPDDVFDAILSAKLADINDLSVIDNLFNKNEDNATERSNEQPTEQILDRTEERPIVESEEVSEVERDNREKEIKPIGKGVFGNIYDQFKGKAKEAVSFLFGRKEGDAIGVFHREEIGDIDLVWGSKENNAGLAHIIDKHINQQNDFSSVEEAAEVISDVIENGTIIKDKWDKAIIEKDGNRVVVSKNIRDSQGNITDSKNWVVTAYDSVRTTKEKTSSAATRVTPNNTYESRAVAPEEVSFNKDNTNSEESPVVAEKETTEPSNSEIPNKSDIKENLNTETSSPRKVEFTYFDDSKHTGEVISSENGKVKIKGEDGKIYSLNERYVKDIEKKIFKQNEKKHPDLYDGIYKAGEKALEIEKQEKEVNPNPTDAQKEAGNYKKGHVKLNGFDITIETVKGTERSGKDEKGKAWSVTLKNSYGYYKRTNGTEGKGEQVDVFIGNNPESDKFFIVDQVNPNTGEFDEHKVMQGFNSIEEARQAYFDNYAPDWKGFSAITELSKDEFSKWLKQNDKGTKAKRKPVSEMSTVKSSAKIEDFGEKIEGAKKDLYSQINSVSGEDILSNPLSKTFPRPDFPKLVKDGTLSEDAALILKFVYDNIPSKPRTKYKLASWAKKVQQGIDIYSDLLSKDGMDKVWIDKLRGTNKYDGLKSAFEQYEEIQKALGFPQEDINLGSYEIKKFMGHDVYTIVKGQYIIKDFDTLEDAVTSLKALLDKNKKSNKITKFNVYRDTKTSQYFIGKKGSVGVVRLIDNMSREDAWNTLKNDYSKILELWNALKVNPKERRSFNRERIGVDYRKGINVTPEKFSNEFGFRGVQFGNWVNNDERQADLNSTYDALMDLSTALNISPRSLSLGGELGIAFGARGSGGKDAPSAHYEPNAIVINLTKRKGAGSLAHEWWHAIDNYFSRKRGENAYLTEKPRQGVVVKDEKVVPDERVRKEMHDAFKGVVSAINESELPDRSKKLDQTRTKKYWSDIIEMSARSFENYVIEKLGATNEHNDYLANFKEIGEWIKSGDLTEDTYPYPNKYESGKINDAFDSFFDTIQEKEDGDNMVLYEPIVPYKTKSQVDTPQFKKWFGDSKVVDEDGKPLVVYHGSSRIFTEFEAVQSSVDFPEAMYFSDNKKIAETYSNRNVPVYKLYLRIENPHILDANGASFNEMYDQIASAMHYAKSNDNDGLIIRNIKDDWEQKGRGAKATTYVTFSPNQIKSATKNNGNFDSNDPNITREIIGEYGAKNLDKAEEATTRIDNLQVAREMEEAKKDAKAIKLATGWERGADGKWRYEIPDIKLTNEYLDATDENIGMPLEKVIIDKGGLLKAYPELKNIKVVLRDTKEYSGEYDNKNKVINVSSYLGAIGENENINNQKEVLIHEIQHAIQDVEGFAKGGSLTSFMDADLAREVELVAKEIKDAVKLKNSDKWVYNSSTLEEIIKTSDADSNIKQWATNVVKGGEKEINEFLNSTPSEQYKRLAGEVEARNASKRMNMSEEEKRNSLLSETEDVSREDQIFLRDNLGHSSESSKLAENTSNEKSIPYTEKSFEQGVAEVRNEKGEEVSFTSNQTLNSIPRQLDLWESRNYTSATGYNSGLIPDETLVERVSSKQDGLTFMGKPLTGTPSLKSSADVAFLFKNLESAATENAFAVFHLPNGEYKVLWVSHGSTSGTVTDPKLIVAAALEFKAEAVSFVHNHPSGNLKASTEDFKMHEELRSAFQLFNINLNDGIIINTDSGKYAVFDSFGEHSSEENMQYNQDNTKNVDVYSFDKQVLYKPSSERTKIISPEDVAQYLSKTKRGTTPKVGALILNRQNQIVRARLFDESYSQADIAKELVKDVSKHGDSVILHSNKELDSSFVYAVKDALKSISVSLLDVVQGKQGEDVSNSYKSWANEGILFEPSAEYNTNSSLEHINNTFNEELQQQIDGTLPDGHVYKLGTPSEILLGTGIPNLPIELSATRLKMKAGSNWHVFDISDVKNLPKAIQNPVAVFSYGDKSKSQNIIVEIQRGDKNFVVGLHFNHERNGLIVNSIRGLFPKENSEWLNWISQGKGLYLDKEKIQTLINQQRTNLADVEYLDLDSITKIVQNFENVNTSNDDNSVSEPNVEYGKPKKEDYSNPVEYWGAVKEYENALKESIEDKKNEEQPDNDKADINVAPHDEIFKLIKEDWFANKDEESFVANVDASNQQEKIKASFEKGKQKGASDWKDIDRAIHVYLDINEKRDQVKNYWNELTQKQKNIVNLALSLTPEQKAIAQEIRDIYDQIGQRALSEEVIHNVLENYVARTWDMSGKEHDEFFTSFTTNTRHSKQRTLGTILEGWAKGYELKTEGATNNLETLRVEINNVIENRKLMNMGLRIKDEDGKPLFTTRRYSGYAEIEHPNFTKWNKVKTVRPTKEYKSSNFIITKDGLVFEKQKVYAPAKIAKNLNNILGRSNLYKMPGVTALTRFNAAAKASMLSWSFFHHMAFSRSYLLGSAVGWKIKNWNLKTAYEDGLKAIKEKDPAVLMLVRNGLTIGRNQEWDEHAFDQKSMITKVLDNANVLPSTRKKIYELHKNHTDFLFSKLGAGLKVKSAMLEYAHLLKKYPDMDANELARMVAKQTNADFGGLHLERMGRNKELQHVMRLALLAPDWTESNIQTMIRTIQSPTLINAKRKMQGKEPLSIDEKKSIRIERKMYHRFWQRALLRTAFISVAFNLASVLLKSLTGNDDDKKMDSYWKAVSKQYSDAFDNPERLNWLAVDITPLYNLLHTPQDGEENMEKHKYFSLLGHFQDPVKFIIDPMQSLKNKSSYVVNQIYQMAQGENWQGKRFTTFDELIGVDDKGVYMTSNKKKGIRVGDPKGGKYRGQLTKWRTQDANTGAVKYSEMPSFMLNAIRGMAPVPMQNALGYVMGEMDAFDAVAHGVGIHLKAKTKINPLEVDYQIAHKDVLLFDRLKKQALKENNKSEYNKYNNDPNKKTYYKILSKEKELKKYKELLSNSQEKLDEVKQEEYESKIKKTKQEIIDLYKTIPHNK